MSTVAYVETAYKIPMDFLGQLPEIWNFPINSCFLWLIKILHDLSNKYI